jgi:nucleoid DNA-binding protein
MRISVKKQMLIELAKESDMSLARTKYFYDVLMNVILKKLERGETVLLEGVGRLVLANTRSFKSNLTSVSIPKHKRLSFKPNVRFARKIRIITREHPIS